MRGTLYFVPPDLLRATGLDDRTTLRRIEPHRLKALVLEDLERYPGSSRPNVHRRVGLEVPRRALKEALDALVEEGKVRCEGDLRWRTYWAVPSIDRNTAQ